MSKIRICTITFDWYPDDPLVRRFAEAAVDDGHLVDVVCLRQRDEKRYERCNGVGIYRVPMSRDFGRPLPTTLLKWCLFFSLAALKTTWLYLKHRYHIVHVHNMPDFLVFSAFVPRLLGAKVILHVQDTCPELMSIKAKGRIQRLFVHLATWQERVSIAFTHHVITVGAPFEKLLLQRGVPEKKLTVILNSADPKIFPAHRRQVREPVPGQDVQPLILMYHGTLAERNGLDTAIRALALALPVVPCLHLNIQGQGEQLPVLKSLVRELNLSGHVSFFPPCPSDKIVDFVVHGDIGIIPYRDNSFMELILPTKAYEFAWMHRPIIASATPAIRSMFRSESIVLCDSSRPESFAEAIIDLCQHPEKRALLAANAAEDYLPYQWEAMAKRYQALLQSLNNKQQKYISPPVAHSKI